MDSSLFHSLKGDNIYFKSLSTADAGEIHDYASDEDVSRFIGWELKNNLNETRDYVEEMLKRESAGTHLYASIVLKSSQKIIGTAMIVNFDKKANHAEVGYVFHKDFWGKGYGTEAVVLMSSFAFNELKLHKLHACIVDANIGSSRVLEKNGFELEGRLKDYFYIDDKYFDEIIYGKLKTFK